MSDPAVPGDQAAKFGSQADFARAQGWRKSYVTALKQQGRLVFTGDGRVDFDASLQRIRDTTGAPERAAPAVQGSRISAAQERERHYSSELKRLEYERAVHKLREADEVRSAADDAGALFRAGVEAWRDRLAPELAALGGDEQRISALLASETDQLLRRLAKRLHALAGGGEGGAA